MKAILWEKLSPAFQKKWGTKENYEKNGPKCGVNTGNVCEGCKNRLRNCTCKPNPWDSPNGGRTDSLA